MCSRLQINRHGIMSSELPTEHEGSGSSSSSSSSSSSALNGVKERMHAHGIEPADFPKALVAHELIGISLLVGAWGACYAVR